MWIKSRTKIRLREAREFQAGIWRRSWTPPNFAGGNIWTLRWFANVNVERFRIARIERRVKMIWTCFFSQEPQQGEAVKLVLNCEYLPPRLQQVRLVISTQCEEWEAITTGHCYCNEENNNNPLKRGLIWHSFSLRIPKTAQATEMPRPQNAAKTSRNFFPLFFKISWMNWRREK